MKRRILIALALSSCIGFSQGETDETRYLLFPEDLPQITGALQPNQLIYWDEGTSIISSPIDEIENLSLQVHKHYGGCGGFIDVTDEISRGQAPEVLVWNESRWRQTPQRRFFLNSAPNHLVKLLVNQANGPKLWAFFTELTSFPDRSATSDNGKKAAEFLADRAKELTKNMSGFSTRFIATGTGSYAKQPSVVATLQGSNPALGHVVIGGHMDTFSNEKPGADDDGSGSSIVMEALRAVSAVGATFTHTIDFVWYSAEERGLVGSSYVVQAFKDEKIPVESVVQFDMVGWNDPDDAEDIYLMTDYTNTSLTETLRTLITTYTDARVGTSQCGYACSDHANWTRAGFPAAFPFEATFGNMNSKLHTGDDKMQYLDQSHAVRFAQTALAYLGTLAKIETMTP